MANKQSAKKENRKNIKRRAHNTSIRTCSRTFVKYAELAIKSGNIESAVEALRKCTSYCMSAARRNVLTKGSVSRKISRLTLRLKRSQESVLVS